ncbi:hypothetical protein R3P38DRAFT_2371104, partial [Favolaschia claudopus]
MPHILSFPTEVLDEIFYNCLPSSEPTAISTFDSTLFIHPSCTSAPLLLCQICRRWRLIAIATPRLWASLNTEFTKHSELVEIWLNRARSHPLSLRLAHPCLPDDVYAGWTPRHLPLLLPKFPQCERLHITDMCFPSGFEPLALPLLESVSFTENSDRRSNAATVMSQLLLNAPKLRQMHWHGPRFSACWPNLSHFSLKTLWFAADSHPIPLLTHVTHLHLDFHPHWQTAINPEIYLLPNVTTLFLGGYDSNLASFRLPALRHLIIGDPSCVCEDHDTGSIVHLLEHSHCTLDIFELSERAHTADFLTLLTHRAVAPSITALVISSYHLNELFERLEQDIPGTLPDVVKHLRPVDRCFHIDWTYLEAATGILASLLCAQFPLLCHLTLDDIF